MAFAAAQDPKELVMVPNANHIDLYDDLKTIPFDQLQQFFDSSLYRLTN
ncbi:hypothetical protein [Secundilactobacillus kimchicus]|nr:hypothetical protein [Secundilactobacillus kimchicus]